MKIIYFNLFRVGFVVGSLNVCSVLWLCHYCCSTFNSCAFV